MLQLDNTYHYVYTIIRKEEGVRTSELKKMLIRAGCVKVREGKRHEIWKSPITGNEFPIGRHNKEVKKGTAEAILKEAGIR